MTPLTQHDNEFIDAIVAKMDSRYMTKTDCERIHKGLSLWRKLTLGCYVFTASGLAFVLGLIFNLKGGS